MKIVLGTHRLRRCAGSELFTAELARAFAARGHEVAVFTFFPGAVAGRIRSDGIPVFGPDANSDFAQFDPDVVQTIHLPCAYYLGSLFPKAVRVHAMLGTVPHLEMPPAYADGFDLGLVVSEEVAEKIARTPFAQSVEIALLRNWFDDECAADCGTREPTDRLGVAVISNHIDPDLRNALDVLKSDGGLSVTYYGVETNQVVVDASLLSRHHLVISIGRTAILAGACGVPVIMADIHGSDGLLTADNLDLVRTVNFSGRLNKTKITPAHLRDEIDRLPHYDRQALRQRVIAEYSLRSRVDWLLASYARLSSRERTGELAAGALPSPSEGHVYADMVRLLRETRQRLKIARKKIAVLEQRREPWLSKSDVSKLRKISWRDWFGRGRR